MKTRNMCCIIAIIGAIILKFAWHLVIKYHGDNTTEQEQLQIAEPIFLGCNVAIFVSIVLIIIFGLLPKRKNLSNSG